MHPRTDTTPAIVAPEAQRLFAQLRAERASRADAPRWVPGYVGSDLPRYAAREQEGVHSFLPDGQQALL